MATFFNFFFFFSSLFFFSAAHVLESANQFRIGGPRGWVKPTGNETETYNQWAARNRFHIGDSLYFKYTNDSVLVVKEEDYSRCRSSNPISKYEDGNTTIQFHHYGFFYFISGLPMHCESGQKLIIWVMAHNSISTIPAAAPSPSAEGTGNGGPGSGSGSGSGSVSGSSSGSDSSSSTVKVTVPTSYFLAAWWCTMATFLFV